MKQKSQIAIEDIQAAWPEDIPYDGDVPWSILVEVAKKLRPLASKCFVKMLASQIRDRLRKPEPKEMKHIDSSQSCKLCALGSVDKKIQF